MLLPNNSVIRLLSWTATLPDVPSIRPCVNLVRHRLPLTKQSAHRDQPHATLTQYCPWQRTMGALHHRLLLVAANAAIQIHPRASNFITTLPFAKSSKTAQAQTVVRLAGPLPAAGLAPSSLIRPETALYLQAPPTA